MEETINTDKNSGVPEKLYLFKKEFFDDLGFRERFEHEMKVIRTQINKGIDRENLKGYINAFIVACFESIKEETTRLYMHLEFFKTLGYYAEVFNSKETFENVISKFENPDLKQKLFGKEPLRSSMIYGEILLKYYSLENEKSKGWFTEEGFGIIRKAKYYILKSYTQSIEGKNQLNEDDFSYCLVLLAACFMHLSRWFEPIFYLNRLKQRDDDDPNYDYLTAFNLDALKDKSCLDYNGQLLFKIHECCTNTIANVLTPSRVKVHATELLENCNRDIQKANLSIETLKKHNRKISERKRKRNAYFDYCIENQFFLNEHALFCNCARSIGDSLEIKTLHPHTKIDWVRRFEKLLDTMVADYAVARNNLFQSEPSKKTIPFYKKESLKQDALQLRKDALLKNSFKVCYSILDQICYGTLEALEIDIDKLTKTDDGSGKTKKNNIYFLNMWDLCQFTVDDFRNNLYLISLFSLAKDLDRTDYSALKSFKDYRNAMEHKILFIEEDGNKKVNHHLKSSIVVSRAVLRAKTKLLMILTKSAIFSFAYLVRRASKKIELENRK